MANDTILTPGGEEVIQPTPQETNQYLEKDNYLSEFQTEEEKAVVRENLGVHARDQVYTKTESNTKLDESIKKAFDKYLNMEDPHGILPTVEEMIEGVVRDDGSTPFKAPQTGVDPIQDFHLATKRFVTKILRDHLAEKDPHKILADVEDKLEQYVKQSEVYFKNQLYTRNEVDKLGGQFIKKDGTTPFTKAQIGADPQIDSHLTTKRYVDGVIYNHLTDVDPHNFISLLNNRLAAYAKSKNVYDKSQTYSRIQIDSIIRSLVGDAAKEAIQEHLNEFDPHNILAEVRKEKYIKQDGTIPFRAPQKGVDAVDPQDLVTLHQVQEEVESIKQVVQEKEPIWLTSGPVEATVGQVLEDTDVPSSLTFQEIMDAIFYGKSISIELDEYVTITETTPVMVCIHGSLGMVSYAELYQGDTLIYTFKKEDFENGCVTVDSLPVLQDTEFTFKVYFTNGAVHEETATIKCAMPVFVGLLPKWKSGHTVTYEYLEELQNEDLNKTQNQFLSYGNDVTSIPFTYEFKDSKFRHPFVVVPIDYPDLESMTTQSQSFTIEAFEVIDRIPMAIPGVEDDIIYKIYIYRQALSSLNQKVTFNFKSKE